MISLKNRVGSTVSGTPGTGTITLGSASPKYQSFSTAYGANAVVDILIVDSNNWEIDRDCTFTLSGTTVTRGTLEASSTGSRLSLTSSAIVYVVHTADRIMQLLLGEETTLPGGRLTLTSGTPVTTSDVTGATTIYYTPHMSNIIPLWDGTSWRNVKFTEKSLSLGTLTNNNGYDIFGYLSSGDLAIELLAWSSSTSRATNISLQDGKYCKSGDHTRLYLGSFLTSSTTTTADSVTDRLVWNMYNQVPKQWAVVLSTYHIYTTPTIRYFNNVTSFGRVMLGLTSPITFAVKATGFRLSGGAGDLGVGVNTSSSITYSVESTYDTANLYQSPISEYPSVYLSLGLNTFNMLELGGAGFEVSGLSYRGTSLC